MPDKNYFSSLSDAAILAEAERIEVEQAEGKSISLDLCCSRLGISIQTALELAAEHATRIHRRPMTISITKVDGKARVKFVPVQ